MHELTYYWDRKSERKQMSLFLLEDILKHQSHKSYAFLSEDEKCEAVMAACANATVMQPLHHLIQRVNECLCKCVFRAASRLQGDVKAEPKLVPRVPLACTVEYEWEANDRGGE